MLKDKDENREYMRKYMLERYHRRKQEAIASLGGKCVVCGSTENIEFDHKERKGKKATLGDVLAGGSEDLVKAELEKCQLLCRECHIKKTIKEVGRTPARETHGTLSSYRYCKCDLCKAAKSKWMKEYKKNRVSPM